LERAVVGLLAGGSRHEEMLERVDIFVSDLSTSRIVAVTRFAPVG
jgi:hypothetical protein